MNKQIDEMTPDQEARMSSWADEYIARGLSTEPADRQQVERGIEACYQHADLPWHGNIVWVGSPMVVALAGPTAASMLSNGDAVSGAVHGAVHGAVSGAVSGAVRGAVGSAVRSAVHDAVHNAVSGAVNRAVGSAVRSAVRGAVHSAVGGAVGSAVRGAVRSAVERAVEGAVRGAVEGAVRSAVHSAVEGAVGGAVHGAVSGAVERAVQDAVEGAVHGAVHTAVHGAVHNAVGGAVNRAVEGAVSDAVNNAVHSAVGSAVRGAVRGAVGGAVHNAVSDAVRGAVHGAVGSAVSDAVRGAVHSAVGGAVSDAVGSAVGGAVHNAVNTGWWRYFGGAWRVNWQAYEGFLRKVCGLTLDGNLDQVADDFADAQSAGWWWPHKDFVIVADRPEVIHTEQLGPPGWGSHLIHCANGPAISFRDGWSLYFWHGIMVTGDWIENPDGIDARIALTHENVELRRCAAEIMGWDRVLAQLSHEVIDADPDPEIGTLIRVDLPDSPGEQFLRVRCGTGRQFALPMPPNVRTAREANAWSYGIEPEDLNLEWRT